MTPRLELFLLPNRTSKTPGPPLPRVPLYHNLNRLLTHQAPTTDDGRLMVHTRIIQERSEQDQCSESRDRPSSSEILMPDDGFADGFGLGFWRAEGLEEG